MKKKIIVSVPEIAFIVAALTSYEKRRLAVSLYDRFEAAPERTDDGPEVAILRKRP